MYITQEGKMERGLYIKLFDEEINPDTLMYFLAAHVLAGKKTKLIDAFKKLKIDADPLADKDINMLKSKMLLLEDILPSIDRIVGHDLNLEKLHKGEEVPILIYNDPENKIVTSLVWLKLEKNSNSSDDEGASKDLVIYYLGRDGVEKCST